VAHPRWALAYWRGRRGRAPAESPFWVEGRPEAVRDPAAALAAITGRPRDRCAAAIDDAWTPEPVPDDDAVWWPRDDLTRIVGALTRLLRPRSAVEVGVARGYTSAAILAALEANGEEGVLRSIDLPPRDVDRDFVGRVVPPRLRARWRLTFGPSRAELPRVAPEAAPIGLFVHDGDHSYRSQREDLEAVWPHLAPGAAIAVDDVWTTAVFDFAAERGEEVVIAAWAEREGVALLRKAKLA
jgi:predicted O-methyltransferase YrrM